MKKITIFALAAFILAAAAGAYAYSGSVAEKAKEYNILEGDENGELHLDEPVTRAELAKILCTVMQENASASDSAFTDISQHWAKEHITAASELGLVNGFEDNTFRPDDNVTYEQAIKMLLGIAHEASYPGDYISYALDNGLLDSVSALAGEYITRGDAAQIIENAIETAKANALRDTYKYPGMAKLAELYGTETQQQITARIYSRSNSAGGGSNRSSSASVNGFAASGPVQDAMPETAEETAEEAYDAYFNPYYSSEEYRSEDENIFKNASLSPLSTFSIDTDTASYSNMRRFLLNGQDIPAGSIRTEELINYFDYDLPQPTDETPFSVTTETAGCPWNDEHLLTMINIQGEELTERQPQNLVFLMDVSGSMYFYNKLPLVKRSMQLLLSRLDERDTISIVTYASGTAVLAEGIPASENEKIMKIINGLKASGGTNGEGGIELAYQQAEKFRCDGNNRIILCTDGDFNIGKSDNSSLKELIKTKRDNGIFLSILGFGMGNYKDSKMEMLADNGDGGYYYIDSLREAKKVLADEITSTLYTIAKDVKIQVEFNPAQVSEYRLIGYENRRLQNEQFADDDVDAGELGAGANVTALYEIVPSNGEAQTAEYKYQSTEYSDSSELMTVRLRYKLPEGGESILKEYPVSDTVSAPSENMRFASGIAELGMLLNKSEYAGSSSYDSVIDLARGSYGDDRYGIRHELVQLVDLLRIKR